MELINYKIVTYNMKELINTKGVTYTIKSLLLPKV